MNEELIQAIGRQFIEFTAQREALIKQIQTLQIRITELEKAKPTEG